MSVIKRDLSIQELSLDKITKRIRILDIHDINVLALVMGVAENITSNIKTVEIDEIIAYLSLHIEKNKASYRELANNIIFNLLNREIPGFGTLSNIIQINHVTRKIDEIKQRSYKYINMILQVSQDKINGMRVINRNNEIVDVSLDEIVKKIRYHATHPTRLNVDITKVVVYTIENMKDNIKTSEIDDVASSTAYSYSTFNTDYSQLSTRIALDNIYKSTPSTFSEFIKHLNGNQDKAKHIIRSDIEKYVMKHHLVIDHACEIMQHHDLRLDYFGISTLKRAYFLLNLDNTIAERPQYVHMRGAIELYYDLNDDTSINHVIECYYKLASSHLSNASPTQFNACVNVNQLSSCMLLTIDSDSIPGIYKTLRDTSILGAATAGLGVAFSNIRARGSIISTTRRASDGLEPFIRIFDANSTVITQGNKRKSSMAIYLEPWHADFMDILHLKEPSHPNGVQHVFLANWLCNLLEQRVKDNANWSMFCPKECPLLFDSYGVDFEKAYINYESAGLARKVVSAKDIYLLIASIMYESGQPYNCNKDACNFKSNLKNVHILHSSNLCAEVLIPSICGTDTTPGEIGVCTLSSINMVQHIHKSVEWLNGVPQHSTDTNWWYQYINWILLEETARQATRNLNQAIDRQMYVLPECERSSLRHRPIGIGIQGLANMLQELGIAYESEDSAKIGAAITEHIAYYAIMESMELAKIHGAYETFIGSPASQKLLQPHLWDLYYDQTPITYDNNTSRKHVIQQYRYKDWDELAERVSKTGIRNSLLLAYMPTASTSQILGNYQSFEPANKNIFSRHTLAGNFVLMNKVLIKAIQSLDMWNEDMQNQLISHGGSVQELNLTPEIKSVFKTVWEMSQKRLLEMSALRGQFICQTQSLNVYIKDPSIAKFTSLISYGMRLGLKTISYYTHTTEASEAARIIIQKPTDTAEKCSRVNKENCEACSA